MNPATPGPAGSVTACPVPLSGGALTARRWRSAGTVPGAVARVLVRPAAAAGAALAVAAVHDAHDPGVLCPLRLMTGVPCPFCGSTTVFIEAGHAHWGAALAANPVTAVAVVALLFAPLGPGRWWRRLSYGRRNLLLGAAAMAAWAWELARFGILAL
ncbi:DUF2752 domain-containing protein [Kitasatospora sp. NPDC059673]|uniref:DUF2752 domain-containing protein n=1 Tax=Kitasatospora sp. NPDC059673 TaxID=3346901 RepID=UPI0036A5F41D